MLTDYSKSKKDILTKLGGKLRHGPEKKPLNFDAISDPGVDQGISTDTFL